MLLINKFKIKENKMKGTATIYSFIPPQILESLAKSGLKEAKSSIHQSDVHRLKRESKIVPTAVFSGIATGDEGPREIWDSETKWEQRVKLVIEESGPDVDIQSANNSNKFIEITREYLQTKLKRNSFDNIGGKLIVNVRYGKKYMNAFWDGDEITLGEGDGSIFSGFDKSLDVLAHELGHGIVQSEANFVYKGQPGALNEHYADVFGTTITQDFEGQSAENADWLIGDEIMGPELYGEAIRSMKAPGSAYDNDLLGKDPQPDHMDNYYSGSADNYGVHINSGIPNRAFYLASKEIGTQNATKIWYHALQSPQMIPTSTFNHAVSVIVKSARILTMSKTVDKGSAQTVRWAFKQVGLPK
jgi:Zn-dependent metalloprotease